jgi:hypothetical protein
MIILIVKYKYNKNKTHKQAAEQGNAYAKEALKELMK